jgi:hypothetical protein
MSDELLFERDYWRTKAEEAMAEITALVARCERADAENEKLRRWKAEALTVLTQWDVCYDILDGAGHVAPVGEHKARYVANFLSWTVVPR